MMIKSCLVYLFMKLHKIVRSYRPNPHTLLFSGFVLFVFSIVYAKLMER
jgi:hypothetical protein